MEENSEEDKNLLELYPINEETEKFLSEISIEPTDKNIYSLNMGPYSSKQFEKLIMNTEVSEFYKGLFHEYGINSYEKNLNKAYNIYLESAKGNKDFLSMYKMYIIHLKQYKKFNIEKDKILELYYLIKCIFYLPLVFFNYEFYKLYDFISLHLCFISHIKKEELKKEKFFQFIELLKKSKKYKDIINNEELELIKLTLSIRYRLDIDKEEEFLNELINLSKDNCQVKYRLICLLIFLRNIPNKNKEEMDKKIKSNIEYLYKNKYYMAYDIVFDFRKMIGISDEEIVNVLMDGVNNGNFFCYTPLFDILTSKMDLETYDIKTNENKLLDTLEIIINSDILGSCFSCYRIYTFIDIITKKLNFNPEIIRQKFGNLIEENALFVEKVNLDAITQSQFYLNKTIINEYKRVYGFIILKDKFTNIPKYINFPFFFEFYLSPQNLFQEARSGIILYKIIKRIKKIDNKHYGFISDEEKDKIYKDIFNSLLNLIKNSDSFCLNYYYLAKFYKNSVGVEQNVSMSFYLLNQIGILPDKINETISSRYKTVKAKKQLKEEIYKDIYTKLNELEPEQCKKCNSNNGDTVFLPCYHKICYECTKNIVNCKNYVICLCPFCNTEVLSFYRKNND